MYILKKWFVVSDQFRVYILGYKSGRHHTTTIFHSGILSGSSTKPVQLVLTYHSLGENALIYYSNTTRHGIYRRLYSTWRDGQLFRFKLSTQLFNTIRGLKCTGCICTFCSTVHYKRKIIRLYLTMRVVLGPLRCPEFYRLSLFGCIVLIGMTAHTYNIIYLCLSFLLFHFQVNGNDGDIFRSLILFPLYLHLVLEIFFSKHSVLSYNVI